MKNPFEKEHEGPTPEVIAPEPGAPTTTEADYRHMFGWFEMLGTADYARKAYFKQAVEARAPIESVYPIYTVGEENARVEYSGKWMQYKDLRSKHMSEGIEKIFEEKGWGDSVNKALASYVYTDCRDMRHAWQSVGDTVLLEKQGRVRVFSRTLECMRCETKRVDTYQLAGHIVQRVSAHYEYTRGYQVKGGLNVEELRWAKFHDAKMVPRDADI